MRVVVQRVSRAAVRVGGNPVGEIGAGLLLLVGFRRGDSAACLAPLAEKIVNLRIFSNEQGRFDLSLRDTGGELLLVPQFTLFADTRKGRRPEFFEALEPQAAAELFDEFLSHFERLAVSRIAQGRFGAHMEVELLNDGPVTIILNQD